MNPTPQPLKKAPLPERNMAVAVDSLTPPFGLLCLQSVEGFEKGITYEVYGGNMNAESFYLQPVPAHKVISKYRRIAADFEEYEHEWLNPNAPLPDRITEVIPSEYPGCFQLIITNAELILVPESEAGAPMGVLREHPAAAERLALLRQEAEGLAEQKYFEKQKKKLARKAAKNRDPNQLFLIPLTDYKPRGTEPRKQFG